MQNEMGQLLASANLEPSPVVACKLCGPLPWPSQSDDDPLAGPLDIEIAKIAICGTPSYAGQFPCRLRSKNGLDRCIVSWSCRAALEIVKNELPTPVALQARIPSFNVLQNGRVASASIFKVERPLFRRKIVIRDADAPNHQPRFGVGIGEVIFRPLNFSRLGCYITAVKNSMHSGRNMTSPIPTPKRGWWFGASASRITIFLR